MDDQGCELVGLGNHTLWGLKEMSQQLLGEEEVMTKMKENLHLNQIFRNADVLQDGVDCKHCIASYDYW